MSDTLLDRGLGGDARPRGRWLACLLLALCASAAVAAGEPIHHRLAVTLDPHAGRLDVEDTLTLPASSPTSVRFSLAAGLVPVAEGGRLERLDGERGGRFHAYRLEVPSVPARVTLRYGGELRTDLHRGDHGMPVAVLDERGVYLDGASGWYPWVAATPVTFELDVTAPDAWQVVSQGRRDEPGRRWQASVPQDDIYLIAGPFERYARAHRGYELEVYLLAPDPATAERYLGVMGGYLDLYSALIADYPYPKFAVVENRWQTGYGMPSFTLLGSRVLRLPFILHSSLPHEILHNWWGNGVFVAYERGNWSEGLTAYLADHLVQEARGSATRYRRQALERYADYAATGRDFPLLAFRARHGDASQAVGYSKALLLFHMVRSELGDPAFVAALKNFWEAFRFREAGFADLKGIVEQTAGREVDALADVWLERPGAPRLELGDVELTRGPDDAHRLRFELRQRQPGPHYPMQVPVAVQLADADAVGWRLVELGGASTRVTWELPTAPLRLDVDPGFEVFRLLAAAERPATLSRLFGDRVQLLILPADAPAAEREAWQALAAFWTQRFGNVRVKLDRELDRLPADEAVWVLGWDNRWLAKLTHRFAAADQSLDGDGLRIGEEAFARTGHAVVVLDADSGRSPLGFVGADAASAAALARKLPHYGSYGRLVFALSGLANQRKEDLAVPRSPLTHLFSPQDPGAPGPRQAPLTALLGVSPPGN
jgi:hypothetical protein